MADVITTEYDDDSGNDFIQCGLCDKSIRGDTQYRIHLTTIQHLKKEEAVSAKGTELPVWKNFLDYLDYLNLDEPIIGLNYLQQTESRMSSNGQLLLKYKCKLCNLEADLPAMASHVVGRRHRQKFLELQRPDLVTWDNFSMNQQGKMIRAKAEVVERQNGRGHPQELPSKQKKIRRNDPQRSNTPSNPRHQNQRKNMGPQHGFPEDPRYQGKVVDDGYYPVKTYRGDTDYPEDASFQDHPEGHFSPHFTKGSDYGKRYPNDTRHKEPLLDDDIRRRPFSDESPRPAYSKGDRHEPSFYEDNPRGQPQPRDNSPDLPYPGEEPRHYRQPYSDLDPPQHGYEDPYVQVNLEDDIRRRHFRNEPSKHAQECDRYDPSRGRSQSGDDHPDFPYPGEEHHQRRFTDDHYSGQPYTDRDLPQHPHEDPHARVYPEEDIRRRPFRDELPRRAYHESDRDDSQGRQQPGDGRPHLPYPEEDHHQSSYVNDHHSGQHYSERDLPQFEDPHSRKEPLRQHRADSHGRQLHSERHPSGHSYPQVDRHQRSDVYEQAYPDRLGKRDIEGDPYGRSYTDDSADWHPKVDTDHRFPGRNASEQYSKRGFQRHQISEDEQREKTYSSFEAVERNRGEETRYGRKMPESVMERDSAAREPPLRASETMRRPYSDLSHYRGATHQDSVPTKKKRSRFSDCTEAEKELLEKYQRAQAISERIVRSPHIKVQEHSERARLGEDYREHGEVIQEPGDVLDVLKDVQIESVEEANFLKNKLCLLLKEFQANKSNRDPAPSMTSRDYGHLRRDFQDRPPSDEYSTRMSDMPAVGRDHDFFHQVSPERLDRRSHERDRILQEETFCRPPEIFEDYPRDDFHRGEYRSPLQDCPPRFREGSQQSYSENPLEEDLVDFRSHPAQSHYDEDARNRPSSLDKIASTILQLVGHK